VRRTYALPFGFAALALSGYVSTQAIAGAGPAGGGTDPSTSVLTITATTPATTAPVTETTITPPPPPPVTSTTLIVPRPKPKRTTPARPTHVPRRPAYNPPPRVEEPPAVVSPSRSPTTSRTRPSAHHPRRHVRPAQRTSRPHPRPVRHRPIREKQVQPVKRREPQALQPSQPRPAALPLADFSGSSDRSRSNELFYLGLLALSFLLIGLAAVPRHTLQHAWVLHYLVARRFEAAAMGATILMCLGFFYIIGA
jgi:hypothetical protein